MDLVIIKTSFIYKRLYSVGTPYHGGIFHCKLVLSSEFPRIPPKGKHTNISIV